MHIIFKSLLTNLESKPIDQKQTKTKFQFKTDYFSGVALEKLV